MTAKTSEVLAQAMDELGLTQLAKRARADEFHDYLSQHDMPTTYLVKLLAASAFVAETTNKALQIESLRKRVMNGDFDATTEESDEWAASEEGQAAMRMLRGPDK